MPLEDRFYYLSNFEVMLRALAARDGDLLDGAEQEFIARFTGLPTGARALLVRMVMRRGPLFRHSRLSYAEIPGLEEALRPLIETGWLDDRPVLTLAEVFKLATRAELLTHFSVSTLCVGRSKAQWLERLGAVPRAARTFDEWCPTLQDQAVKLSVTSLCDRLRLLFFGNFRQELSEFVLADLGVFKYEHIELHQRSRPFQNRHQIEAFYQLHECRKALYGEGVLREIHAALPPAVDECEWLEERRQKLQFQVAREYERAGEVAEACALYSSCSYGEARRRLARLTEGGRLRAARGSRGGRNEVPTFDLSLPKSDHLRSVEHAVLGHLTASAEDESRVLYVENSLINSLFGLLCWTAVFAPLPGAFFHAFHHGPADLGSPGFCARRARQFAECLSQLDDLRYQDTIRHHFAVKAGIASPFVAWGLLDPWLLETALDCLPPRHLRLWFDWILRDLRANRSGFPDLVQFWPQQRRYRLIEVKGPGDRLQVNQRRWFDYCLDHDMPVSVCRVRWLDAEVA